MAAIYKFSEVERLMKAADCLKDDGIAIARKMIENYPAANAARLSNTRLIPIRATHSSLAFAAIAVKRGFSLGIRRCLRNSLGWSKFIKKKGRKDQKR
jgi:hypothetical protein